MPDPHHAPPRARRTFVRRLVAFGVDGIALLIAGFLVLTVSNLLFGPTVILDLDAPASPVADVREWRAVVNAVLLTALSCAYFVSAWSRSGRTPGQRLLRLTVAETAPTRERLSIGRATLRWALLGAPLGVAAAMTVAIPLLFLAVALLSFAWFMALLLTTLVSRSSRGLHDRLAGTIVTRSD